MSHYFIITSWWRHLNINLTSWCRLLELILELPWYSGGAHPPRFNPGTYANFSLVRPRKITIPLCGISKGACHPFGMYAIGTPASPGCSTCIFPPITKFKLDGGARGSRAKFKCAHLHCCFVLAESDGLENRGYGMGELTPLQKVKFLPFPVLPKNNS